MSIFIHPTANVAEEASIGEGTKVWINSQIREGTSIGKNCIISKDTYIDENVKIGDNCKIYSHICTPLDKSASLYSVFVRHRQKAHYKA